MTAFLFVVVGLLPVDGALEDRVDGPIVADHHYDNVGDLIFNQAIFYEWHSADGAHHVVAWRLMKLGQYVVNDYHRGGCYMIWLDGEDLRCVRGLSRAETWTQPLPYGAGDRELMNREHVPRNERRGLSRWKKPGR